MGKGHEHLGEELLSAFVDGETSPYETDLVRRHAAGCPSCASRLDAFRALDSVLASAVELSCDAVRPLLSAELDGELEPDLLPLARQHLAGCASCQADRSAWRAAEERLRAMPALSPSRRVDDAIAAVVGRRAPARRMPAFRSLAPGLVRVATAALVVALGVSGSVLLTRTPEQAAVPTTSAVVVASLQTAVLDARTNTLYVLDTAQGLVVARDATTDRAITQVHVGGQPTALALNERTSALFVLDSGSKTLTEIDTQTHSVVRSDQVQVSGTPTSVNVDAANGKLLVATTASPSAGQLAVIDAGSRQVDAVRFVDVLPSLVLVDPIADRTFLLGSESTIVLDSKTFEKLATLPGAGIGGAANGRGTTAILTATNGRAKVHLYGTGLASFDLPGAPVAISVGPRGTFAALVAIDVRTDRLLVLDASGLLGTRDVFHGGKGLAFDEKNAQFFILGERGAQVATLPSDIAPTALASPTVTPPPQTESPAPTVAPTSTPAPTQPPAPTPTQFVGSTTGLRPDAARALWHGAYYFETGQLQPLAHVGRGLSLWFVDQQGGVNVLDTRNGYRGTIARLPGGTKPSYIALGQRLLYVLDTEAQTLFRVDLVSAKVESVAMPFGRTIVAMDVAANDHAWFASSTVGALIEFNPNEEAFRLVDRRAGKISALSAGAFGKIWFAYSANAMDSVVGVYDWRWGTADEYRLEAIGAVDAVFVDTDGTTWVSSARAGFFPLRDGTAGAAVSGTAVAYQSGALAPNGSLWRLFVDEHGGHVGQVGGSSMSLPAAARGVTIDDRGQAWVADPINRGFYIIARVAP